MCETALKAAIKTIRESENRIIIAVDGPAGSGKSSTSKFAAEKLGYVYIDTGAMYRAVTFAWLEEGYPLAEKFAEEVLLNAVIELEPYEGGQRTLLNGRDISDDIRTPEITKAVSPISAMNAVREVLTLMQREMGEKGGIIMDGRDIGTVVFPNADLKIFFTASTDIRAKRRYDELIAKGRDCDYDVIKNNIIARDKYDTEREASPLKQAEDALLIDTDPMTLEEQACKIIELAAEVISRGNS
jgi:cytidylate kinase